MAISIAMYGHYHCHVWPFTIAIVAIIIAIIIAIIAISIAIYGHYHCHYDH